jgi:dephospho-CoA kinase
VSEKEVRRRMEHQMNEEEKRALADDVLLNDEQSLLLPKIIELHNRIIKSIS